MKRKVVDVLLITLVFTACVVKVAPISGQNKENTIQNNTNKENTKENTDKNNIKQTKNADKRGISSVIEDSLENNNISGKTKHVEETVKESPAVEEEKIRQEGWTTSTLNVREEPNTDSNVLDTLPFNTYIKYYEYNDEWAEIAFDNGQAYISRDYISDEECDFVMYDIPKYEGFKSWMSYKAITNRSSKQYKLQQIASTGYAGIRTVNNRYCVAIGTAFDASIGTYIDLILEDGFVIPCIVADIKSPKHTDANNVFTITGKTKKTICCTEFVIDPEKLNVNAMESGNISDCNELWTEHVRAIVVYDKNVW